MLHPRFITPAHPPCPRMQECDYSRMVSPPKLFVTYSLRILVATHEHTHVYPNRNKSESCIRMREMVVAGRKPRDTSSTLYHTHTPTWIFNRTIHKSCFYASIRRTRHSLNSWSSLLLVCCTLSLMLCLWMKSWQNMFIILKSRSIINAI